MNQETNNIICEFDAAIVGYLYREISETESRQFEDHLLDCVACTDAFAGLAESRFAVYEWHQEEFVPMATPTFTIPGLVGHETFGPRLTAAVRGWIGAGVGLKVAFASVAFLVSGGMIFSIFQGSGSNEIASNVVLPPAPVIERAIVDVDPEPVPQIVAVDTPETRSPKLELRTRTPEPQAKPRVLQAKVIERHATEIRNNLSVAPSLDDGRVEEDNSLRLSDLLADADTLK